MVLHIQRVHVPTVSGILFKLVEFNLLGIVDITGHNQREMILKILTLKKFVS